MNVSEKLKSERWRMLAEKGKESQGEKESEMGERERGIKRAREREG